MKLIDLKTFLNKFHPDFNNSEVFFKEITDEGEEKYHLICMTGYLHSTVIQAVILGDLRTTLECAKKKGIDTGDINPDEGTT